ncbi:sensor histidine kinase [Compostimonas suwonensis]|uniref:histidine kinase n=1 Tax=Compostimonas suwonensis TaxID=1048394 RepID=A0A2M9C044_9MICO|nr:histidine kinase [Compostimonas suwonensis]PJJ63684.1 histidine kinase [Compostimonas suwonensis]
MRRALVITLPWLVLAIAGVLYLFGSAPSPLGVGSAIVLGGVPLVLGFLVAWRAPGVPAGALLAAAGAGAVLGYVPNSPDGPLGGLWMMLYAPLGLLLLGAPVGLPRSRAGWGFWWAGIGVAVAFIGVNVAESAWPEASGMLDVPGFALLPCFLAFLVAAVLTPVRRYRHADARERLQLRWIFVAAASLPLTLLLCWVSYLLLGTADLVVVGLFVTHLAIPAAVAIAALRPEWFDIDRVALATVTVGVIGVFVLALLSVAAVLTGLALLPWSPPVALVAAVVLSLAAAPLYRLVRRWLEQRIYPARGRARAALSALAVRVNQGAAEPEQIEAALREALHDDRLTVAVRRLSDHALIGVDGIPVVLPGSGTPVRMRGEQIGVIVASEGSGRLPDDVRSAAAPLMDAVRMRAELAHAAAELAASRERIVRAGVEERRRLERDIHDGAQQRLVALGMQLRVLQRTAGDLPTVTASLDTAVAELSIAVAELRRLAHGIRPSTLDDGLVAALSDLGRLRPDIIELHVHAGELPDEIATTAYYVASEAITNALKHADATRIRVDVRQTSHELAVQIGDDGRGGADIRPATGLAGLQDRVAGIGGRLTVTSPPAGGTIVEALLPCPS